MILVRLGIYFSSCARKWIDSRIEFFEILCITITPDWFLSGHRNVHGARSGASCSGQLITT